jgi:hypothetical protein
VFIKEKKKEESAGATCLANNMGASGEVQEEYSSSTAASS